MPYLRETLWFLGLDSEGVSTEAAIADATKYFQWKHGLQHARPVKKIFLPWQSYWPSMPNRIQYHSRQLCYHASGIVKPNQIEMLDLETGKKSIWTGSETGPLHRVSLSDRYLLLRTIKV